MAGPGNTGHVGAKLIIFEILLFFNIIVSILIQGLDHYRWVYVDQLFTWISTYVGSRLFWRNFHMHSKKVACKDLNSCSHIDSNIILPFLYMSSCVWLNKHINRADSMESLVLRYKWCEAVWITVFGKSYVPTLRETTNSEDLLA